MYKLTLVLQFKTSKIINDMAKVQIKSEKVTPFGGIFHVRGTEVIAVIIPKYRICPLYDFPMTIAHGIERAGAHNGERMLSSLLF